MAILQASFDVSGEFASAAGFRKQCCRIGARPAAAYLDVSLGHVGIIRVIL